MALWPASLPQRPQTDGYSERPAFPVVQAPVDGPALSRLRYTAAPVQITQTFRMTPAQLATFETFYRDDTKLGAVTYTWNERGDSGNPVRTYRIVEAPEYTPAVDGTMWDVTLSVIKMPA